jgi:hypothetical protein
MAVYARMKKIDKDAATVRYLLDDGEHADRIVIFKKSSEEIYPEDGNKNAAFEGAARKLAVARRSSLQEGRDSWPLLTTFPRAFAEPGQPRDEVREVASRHRECQGRPAGHGPRRWAIPADH